MSVVFIGDMKRDGVNSREGKGGGLGTFAREMGKAH